MSGEFVAGDLVVRTASQTGRGAVVSQPITVDSPGHVLTLHGGSVVGITASIEDVEPIEDESQGFAQLAYSLIKLGSHIIEQKLLVYGPSKAT